MAIRIVIGISLMFVVCRLTLAQVPGQALALDGADDYIDVAHAQSLAVSGSLTLEAWIRIDSYPIFPAVIATKKRRNPYQGFLFHLQDGSLTAGGYQTQGFGLPLSLEIQIPWTVVPLGVWTHVAAVFSGPSVSLFVNGILRGTVIGTGAITASTTNPLRIGHDCESPTWNPNSEFAGLIDEFRYWSVARTGAEIQANMYQEIDGAAGLVGAWHFNGSVIDSTGGHASSAFGNAGFVAQSPLGCPLAQVCLGGNLPFPIGGIATLTLYSPTRNAPLLVLLDSQPGSTPLGPYGVSELAWTGGIFAVASYFPALWPTLASPQTDVYGTWRWDLPLPPVPALQAITLFGEAFVFDFSAPNALFRQSNLLPISFQ